MLRVFAPITTALSLSLVLFGLWPWSIPVGAALLLAAFLKRRIEYTMLAAPCLTPYISLYSWSGATLAGVKLIVGKQKRGERRPDAQGYETGLS